MTDDSQKHRTVLVASADRLFADAARAYLDRQPGWRSVGAVADGLQALAAVARVEPMAVLVLGDLPGLRSTVFARQVRRRWPGVSVVVVGEDDEFGVPRGAGAAAVLAALSAEPAAAAPPRADLPDGLALLRTLTRRERRVLQLLAEGLSTADTAAELGLSAHTVRTHMQRLYAKLRCHSRLEVLRFAAEHGFLEREGDAR